MGLTQGTSCDASSFNTLKANVKAEVATRRSQSFTDVTVSQGATAAYSHANSVINGLRAINPTTTNFNTVSSGSIMNAIGQLETAYTVFHGKPTQGNDSGCASGCVGLCQGCTGCTNACTSCSGCTNACSGCKGCTNKCSGCKGCTGCDGTCINGCVTTQRGCCTGCDYGCYGGCTGICSTNCSNSCAGGAG